MSGYDDYLDLVDRTKQLEAAHKTLLGDYTALKEANDELTAQFKTMKQEKEIAFNRCTMLEKELSQLESIMETVKGVRFDERI